MSQLQNHDIAGADVGADTPSAAETVHAELIWTSAAMAPDVLLSFMGSAEPVMLWASLRAIGWDIPPCPPPPKNAIEWVHDPETGEDFTIKPWRVEEFGLRPGTWTSEDERTVGAQTIAALQQHEVNIRGLRGDLADSLTPSGSTSTPPTEASAISTPPSVAQPPEQQSSVDGRVVFLEPASESPTEIEGVTRFAAHQGRKKTAWIWGEHRGDVTSAIDWAALGGRGGRAWRVPADAGAPESVRARTLVQMIVPGADTEDADVAKLVTSLPNLNVVELIPIDGEAGGLLLWAAVAPNSVELLTSSMRLRLPNGITRTE